MKNIRLYSLDADYKSEINDIVRPYVAYAEDTKKVYYGPVDHVAGDIEVWDTTKNRFRIVSLEEFTAYESILEPNSVLVVPESHTADGKPRFMSLNTMSVLTPESGSVKTSESPAGTDITMPWGGYNQDIPGLTNYTTVACYREPPTATGISVTSDDYAYLPSSSFSSGGVLSLDGQSYYEEWAEEEELFAPSPYNSNGSPNDDYKIAGQALSDMDGKANTNAILATCNPAELVPGGTVTNLSGLTENGYQSHAPAVTCHRYKTTHTNSGDWYLPAAGEVGYLISRREQIDSTLSALNAMGYAAIPVSGSVWLWSSTEYSADGARGLFTYSGHCYTDDKYYVDATGRVRAFHA